jgi:hypothetical protein
MKHRRATNVAEDEVDLLIGVFVVIPVSGSDVLAWLGLQTPALAWLRLALASHSSSQSQSHGWGLGLAWLWLRPWLQPKIQGTPANIKKGR